MESEKIKEFEKRKQLLESKKAQFLLEKEQFILKQAEMLINDNQTDTPLYESIVRSFNDINQKILELTSTNWYGKLGVIQDCIEGLSVLIVEFIQNEYQEFYEVETKVIR